MKVFILSGGLGTRLAEYTKMIPKPMVKILGYPILIHIIKHYVKFGYLKFYIATGYKAYVIKKYFKNYKKEGKPFTYKILNKDCQITIVNTGLKTLTGGRLKRLSNYLNDNENFFFTLILALLPILSFLLSGIFITSIIFSDNLTGLPGSTNQPVFSFSIISFDPP